MNEFSSLLLRAKEKGGVIAPFPKTKFTPGDGVEDRPEEANSDIRCSYEIAVGGKTPHPPPVSTLEEIGLPEYISKVLSKTDFKFPSPLQCQGWPAVLGCRDVFCHENLAPQQLAHGTDKSRFVAIPAVNFLNQQPLLSGDDGPIALFLAPTPNACASLHEEAERYGKSTELRSWCVVQREAPQNLLVRNVEMLSATPGAVVGLLEANLIRLNRVAYLFIDELSKMLELGFLPYLEKIMGLVRADRVLLMWTARMNGEVQDFAKKYLFEPLHILIGREQKPERDQEDEEEEEEEEEEEWVSTVDLFQAPASRDPTEPPRKKQKTGENESPPPAPAAPTSEDLLDPNFETVLLLRNLVAPGDVDEDLREEVMSECSKFGPVVDCFVYEARAPQGDEDEGLILPEGVKEPDGVRLFVKFYQREVCLRARRMFHGRPFAGRIVCADVFSHTRYAKLDFSCSPKDPSLPTVLLLRNMVMPGEVDEDLPGEIAEELTNYGNVEKVRIWEVAADPSIAREEAVRIFGVFEDPEDCLRAVLALNGRLFNGRISHCTFYDRSRWDLKDLSPDADREMPLPQKCFDYTA